MRIKDVLELVQKYVAEYVLNRYIKKASGLDAQTSFYLYSRLSELDSMPFDTANLISKSLNIDLKAFEQQGLVKSISKGRAKGVKLIKYREREYIGMESLIDAVHLVMATFDKGGFADVERELNNIPYSRTEIKDILEAFLSLSPEDPERQVSQRILEKMGHSFPKGAQRGIDEF